MYAMAAKMIEDFMVADVEFCRGGDDNTFLWSGGCVEMRKRKGRCPVSKGVSARWSFIDAQIHMAMSTNRRQCNDDGR